MRRNSLCLLCMLFMARLAGAQDTTSPQTSLPTSLPSSLPAARAELPAGWVPLGLAPVDQAGTGRRGYVLSGEDSNVTAKGSNRFAIHAVAANNFYREEKDEYVITRRFEAHTIALDYRRGFKLGAFPRFEIGGQIQLHQSGSGVMNGLILGVESFWASLTGYQKSKNELRGPGATPPPLGTVILRNGSAVYRADGAGSGIGDVYAVAKVALLDRGPSSGAARVAARVAVNAAGSSPFSHGNFVGVGLSLDKKLSEGTAFHADIRATRVLDQLSAWNLPLRRWTYGFSAGPEFRLPGNSSLNLQIDGSSTPYLPTGTRAFDKGYGAMTFGLGKRFGPVTAQLYVRENMNLPFTVRWNMDPDLSVGLKVRIH